MRLSSNFKFVIAISTLALATATLSTSVQANNGFYQVTNVDVSDSLNIRSGAGVSFPVIGTIPANGRTIMTTGNTEQVGSSAWSEVVWLGQIGWVNSRYLASGNQPAEVAPQPVHSRKKPAQVNYNYQADDANAHTHPANRCTRTISHSHPNGAGQHKHHYSCEPNSARAVAAPVPAAPVNNANSHTHPRNECTNSITHTHPNGAGAHEHHYSCQSAQTMSRPKYNPRPKYNEQPKYIRYNN